MATLDLTEAVSRIRLAVGDVTDLPYLSDDTYQYCLDQNTGNESAATRMAAQLILAQLSYGSHQKIGQVEVWGTEAFANYLKFIKQVISNPAYNSIAGVYVGGMNLSDVQSNLTDSTLVQKRVINYPTSGYDDSTENLYGVVTEDIPPYRY